MFYAAIRISAQNWRFLIAVFVLKKFKTDSSYDLQLTMTLEQNNISIITIFIAIHHDKIMAKLNCKFIKDPCSILQHTLSDEGK